MEAYLPRVADGELASRMRSIGAVLIQGPKACGKTVTASRIVRTTVRLDEDESARMAVTLAPDQLFNQPTPILFDEWQVEPAIWNRVRRNVDDRNGRGLYILTGSATPQDDIKRHSGAGRIGTLRMRPMSLFESGHSSGEVSMRRLLDGEAQSGSGADVGFEELTRRIVIGGWPSLVQADEDEARAWLNDYLTQIAEVDIHALGVRRNPRNIKRLLAALGRSAGQAVKGTELAKDVGGSDGPIARNTLLDYLDALERLHLIEDSESWRPHMRSRTRLRTAPVRYFVDPSIALAALNVGSHDLRTDLNATGFHFEALVIRDLRIYSQPLGGVINSWRDSNGNEVDAVVSLPGGRWAAFEVKMSPAAVDEAAASLLHFASMIDHGRHGQPAALGVITSTGYAGRRPDGVHVIPVSAMGP